jgi:hypothetical protein
MAIPPLLLALRGSTNSITSLSVDTWPMDTAILPEWNFLEWCPKLWYFTLVQSRKGLSLDRLKRIARSLERRKDGGGEDLAMVTI